MKLISRNLKRQLKHMEIRIEERAHSQSRRKLPRLSLRISKVSCLPPRRARLQPRLTPGQRDLEGPSLTEILTSTWIFLLEEKEVKQIHLMVLCLCHLSLLRLVRNLRSKLLLN